MLKLLEGRGLHSFRYQLNFSSALHRVTQLNPECVLELLKLSSNVNECKPLLEGPGGGRADLQAMCKPAFDKFQWYRPKATRSESSEVYLVARGRK